MKEPRIAPVKPTIRKRIAHIMKKHPEWTQKEAEEYYVKLQKKKENILKIELSDEQLEKLEKLREKMAIDSNQYLLDIMISDYLELHQDELGEEI